MMKNRGSLRVVDQDWEDGDDPDQPMRIGTKVAIVALAVTALIVIAVAVSLMLSGGGPGGKGADVDSSVAEQCHVNVNRLTYDGYSDPEENGSIYEIIRYVISDGHGGIAGDASAFVYHGDLQRVQCPAGGDS